MDIVTLLSSFERLREAWALSARAKGGVAALAGFEFQLAKALLELIRRDSAGEPFVFMEAVSDLVRIDQGLVISQAKLTLSSSAIGSALEELWEIDGLLQTVTPDLRDVVRYEVQSARSTIGNAQGSLLRWTPRSADLEPERLVRFKAKVAFVSTPSPRLEAARLLMELYRAPNALNEVDRYLGRLLAASSTGAFEVVTEEIVQQLRQLRIAGKDQERRIGLWGADDQPPATVRYEPNTRRAVRVGERLTPLDLREGRLAPRRIYDDIQAAAEAALAAADGNRLPALWIEGRSGAGKSAALLHLVSRIYDEDPQRVVLWLGPHAERLGEAVRWASELVREGRQLVIALDDPCSAERQEGFATGVQEAFTEWQAQYVAAAGCEAPAPFLLCCGPGEQRHVAEDLVVSEVEFATFTLPRESAEDLEELAAWYRTRTGREAVVYEGDILLVQRFFEWNEGRLQDFASRFRRRVSDFDRDRPGEPVLGLVASILAFGRLYADFPAAALRAALRGDPQSESAFLQLSEEEAHFSFGPTSQAGVRLTHPHLADAIYQEWYGRPVDRPYRREHLRRGLVAAIQSDEPDPALRLAPLWAIARLLRSPESRGEPVDPEMRRRLDLVLPELKELLVDLYPLVPEPAVFTDLPVWAALASRLELPLTASPVDRLTGRVRVQATPERGLRLSCHMLLRLAGSTASSVYAVTVADLLSRLVDWRDGVKPWHEWGWIAIDYIYRFGAHDLRASLLRLIDRAADWPPLTPVIETLLDQDQGPTSVALARAWLRAAPTRLPRWSNILTAVLTSAPDEVADTAQRFLAAHPEHPAWPRLWRSLFERCPSLHNNLSILGRGWLGLDAEGGLFAAKNLEHRDMDRVWSALLEHETDTRRDELTAFGLDWLRGAAGDNLGWPRVWGTLWALTEVGEVRGALRDLAMTWLQSDHVGAGWSYVWQPLAKAARGTEREALSNLGRVWLRAGHQNHQGWGFVWEQEYLDAASEERGELVALADQWLADIDAQRQGWVHLWRLMRELDAIPVERWAVLAEQWLESLPDHQNWAVVYGLAASTSDPWIALGQRWLREGRVAGWGRVFRSWRAIGADPQAAAELAIERLGTSEDPPDQWAAVWQSALSPPSPDHKVVEQLVGLAEDWLARNQDQPAWPFVWSRARGLLPTVGGAAGADAGIAWLRGAEGSARGWGHVYVQVLRDLGPTAELVTMGSTWLTRDEGRHAGLQRVWLELANTAPQILNDPDLLLSLNRRLRTPSGPSSGWFDLWRWRIDRPPPWDRDEGVLEGAMSWLRRAISDPGSLFPFVWSSVFALNREELRNELEDLAMRWLRASSFDRRGWITIWGPLVRGEPRTELRAELVSLGLARMKAGDAHAADWGAMRKDLRAVELTTSEQAELGTITAAWLATHEGDARWFPMLHANVELGLPWREDALTRLQARLAGVTVPQPHDWRLWRAARLYAPSAERAALDSQALNWISAAPGLPTPTALSAFQLIKSRRAIADQVAALAAKWLVIAAPSWPAWIDAWRAVRARTPDILAFGDLPGRQDAWLLQSNNDGDDWVTVLRLRLTHMPDLMKDDELRAAAVRWLRSSDESGPMWSVVAAPTIAAARSSATDVELLKHARAWLTSHRGHRGWPFVWAALWRHEASDPARRRAAEATAQQWLSQAPPNAVGRFLVAKRVGKGAENKKPRAFTRGR